MASDNQGQYPDYPVFKGLQKPLEFLGLQGRYIYWAAGAVGGGILGFLIFYMWLGFVVGLVLSHHRNRFWWSDDIHQAA